MIHWNNAGVTQFLFRSKHFLENVGHHDFYESLWSRETHPCDHHCVVPLNPVSMIPACDWNIRLRLFLAETDKEEWSYPNSHDMLP